MSHVAKILTHIHRMSHRIPHIFTESHTYIEVMSRIETRLVTNMETLEDISPCMSHVTHVKEAYIYIYIYI